MKFKEFGPIILLKFSNEESEKNMLYNANNAIHQVNTELFHEFS